MTEIGSDEFKDAIFELELEPLQRDPKAKLMPALRRLIKAYDQLSE